MTTPSPTVDAPNDWDENRLRELLRRHKPFTPRLRTTLLHLAACAQAYERAKAEYAFEAALTGAPDCARLRVIIRRFTKARHDALVGLGQDRMSSDVLPAAPIAPFDA